MVVISTLAGIVAHADFNDDTYTDADHNPITKEQFEELIKDKPESTWSQVVSFLSIGGVMLMIGLAAYFFAK